MDPLMPFFQYSPLYQQLSHNPQIVQEPPPIGSPIFEIPEVQMDQYAITDGGIVGTLDVVTCFASCVQGSTLSGRNILALAHSSIDSISSVQNFLKDHLINAQCLPATIKSYVVGGLLSNDDGPTTCLDQEMEALQYAQANSLVGALFNVISTEDEGLSVIFTPNCVRVCKGDLFRPTENIGSDL
jgi:hypothetical protein